MRLEIVLKTPDVDGYSLDVKCKEPLELAILPFENKVTKVMIKVSMFGDKQFADFFYEMIDANLARIRLGIKKRQLRGSSGTAPYY